LARFPKKNLNRFCWHSWWVGLLQKWWFLPNCCQQSILGRRRTD